MEVLDRSKSQTAGVTTYLKHFTSVNEHAAVSTYDEIIKRNAHLINPRPELFCNLKSFLNGYIEKFSRIITTYGGATSSYLITDVGFSHLINYCLKNDLPVKDDDLRSLCFIVLQIFDPKSIRRGGAQLMFDQFIKYFEGITSTNDKLVGIIIANILNHLTIKIDFSTITYIVKYQGCINVRNEILTKFSHQLSGDQIGAFSGGDANKYDAVSFMSMRVRINTIVCVLNHMVDIGWSWIL